MLSAVLLAQICARTGRRKVHVTPAGMEKLASHAWPGNLRELANVLERGTILAPTGDLGASVLDLPRRQEDPDSFNGAGAGFRQGEGLAGQEGPGGQDRVQRVEERAIGLEQPDSVATLAMEVREIERLQRHRVDQRYRWSNGHAKFPCVGTVALPRSLPAHAPR